ncbi:MAG: helix-hairpin-helix domain-containing protein [Acidobacteriota bacterium]|nr:helix-hairpin-helix domain-containing protein [Acidobacteriota bacterium]
MKACKRIILNICKIPIKLFPSVIACLLLVCCVSNQTKQVLSPESHIEISPSAININSASPKELEKLPHIGAKIAQRIVEFRSEYGAFRRPEHLLLVDGISDAHFREMRNLIKVE